MRGPPSSLPNDEASEGAEGSSRFRRRDLCRKDWQFGHVAKADAIGRRAEIKASQTVDLVRLVSPLRQQRPRAGRETKTGSYNWRAISSAKPPSAALIVAAMS